jgi:hypothetical protein
MTEGGKVRILCLHGFLQNASNFRGRTGALRKALKTVADLEYIDGPVTVEGGEKRSWWVVEEGGSTCDRWNESIEYLEDVWRKVCLSSCAIPFYLIFASTACPFLLNSFNLHHLPFQHSFFEHASGSQMNQNHYDGVLAFSQSCPIVALWLMRKFAHAEGNVSQRTNERRWKMEAKEMFT